jgi:hypothetical protein
VEKSMCKSVQPFSLHLDERIGSTPWTPPPEIDNASYRKFAETIGHGYSPEGMFHFFGPDTRRSHSFAAWNAPDLWRQAFLSDLNWTAIAEDAFGHQFCIRADGRRPAVKVVSLWRGTFSLVANSFDDFIRDIVVDPEGWKSLKELYDSIVCRPGMEFQPFKHLSPDVPPMIAPLDQELNYNWTDSGANASLLAQVYAQTKNLPPGTRISQINISPIDPVT